MNKSKIIIVILSIVLVVCCIVLGIILSFDPEKKEDNLVLSCDSDVIQLNKELKCSLKGKIDDYEVSAISATIKENKNFLLKEITPASIWQGDGELGDIELYTDNNKKGNFDILTFKILLNETQEEKIDLSIEDITLFDKDFKEHKLNNIVKTITVKNEKEVSK